MTIDRDDTRAEADQGPRVVVLGMQALDEARAQGTLPPKEADHLAIEEVRAVRRARRQLA